MRTLVETKALVGERGAYRLVRADPRDPGSGDASRPSWRPASTACAPRTSACCRRRPSSARTCRVRSCRRSPGFQRTSCARPRAAAGGRIPLRDAALSRSRVHLQARADPRGGVRRLLHERRRSLHARVVEAHRTALRRPPRASTSSGSPIMRSRASCGTRRSITSARRAPRLSSVPPTGGSGMLRAGSHCPAGIFRTTRATTELAIDLRLELRSAACPLGGGRRRLERLREAEA